MFFLPPIVAIANKLKTPTKENMGRLDFELDSYSNYSLVKSLACIGSGNNERDSLLIFRPKATL